MGSSLTDQFIAALQAKFGITISDPANLILGSSSVSDSALKAAAAASPSAAASTAGSAAAASSGSGASSFLQNAMAIPSTVSGVSAIKNAAIGPSKATTWLNEATNTLQQNRQEASDISNQLGTDRNLLNSADSYNKTVDAISSGNQKLASLRGDLGSANSNLDAAQRALDASTAPLGSQERTNLQTNVNEAKQTVSSFYDATQRQQELLVGNVDSANALASDSLSEYAQESPIAGYLDGKIQKIDTSVMKEEVAADKIYARDATANLKESTADYDAAVKNASESSKNGLMAKLKAVWSSPYTKLGTAALAGFGLFESIKGLKDHFSMGGVVGAGASLSALLGSLNSLHGLLTKQVGALFSSFPHIQALLTFLTSPIGMAVVVAAIVLIAVLFGATKNTAPSPVEMPVVNMPTVWTQMPVYMMTIGAALAGAGISLGPTAPISQTLTIPTVQLASVMNSAGLTDVNGNAVASAPLAGSVFVSQGTGSGGADQVVYVTSGGSGQSVAHVTTLKPGLKFASPASPGNAYLNFFNGNAPNGDAVQGLQTSVALSAAAPTLAGTQGSTAQQLSAAANKNTSVTGVSVKAPMTAGTGR